MKELKYNGLSFISIVLDIVAWTLFGMRTWSQSEICLSLLKIVLFVFGIEIAKSILILLFSGHFDELAAVGRDKIKCREFLKNHYTTVFPLSMIPAVAAIIYFW